MGADITQWQGDWGKLTKCLAISIENCRVVGLSMFPLGYLINSLFLQFTSFFGVTLKDEMGVINASFLLFPIVVAVLIHTLTIALRITACYLTFLLCSPLPAFYISSGALEIQAGVLIGLFISSVHYLSIEKKSSNKSIFYYGLLAVSGLLLPLYKDTNVPIYANLLKRNKATHSQGQKNKLLRYQNLADAFVVVDSGSVLKNAKVLLIDDVLTSGATANACAQVLLRAGVSSVEVLTIARAVKETYGTP